MTPALPVAGIVIPAAAVAVGVAQMRTRRRPADGADGAGGPAPPADPRATTVLPVRPTRRRLPRAELRAWAERGVALEDVDLERADLAECHLDGHDFAHLSLFRARLSRASMQHCRMVATDLSYADLRGVDLRHADLRAANLLDADLGRADLRGANLSSARHLSSTTLRRSRFDRTTSWPPGFDPDAAGARREPFV